MKLNSKKCKKKKLENLTSFTISPELPPITLSFSFVKKVLYKRIKIFKNTNFHQKKKKFIVILTNKNTNFTIFFPTVKKSFRIA